MWLQYISMGEKRFFLDSETILTAHIYNDCFRFSAFVADFLHFCNHCTGLEPKLFVFKRLPQKQSCKAHKTRLVIGAPHFPPVVTFSTICFQSGLFILFFWKSLTYLQPLPNRFLPDSPAYFDSRFF